MRKNIAKFAAVGLSLALVVTSVNLPSNTASAAAKKAKLSATKKTITAKKSATLKLKKKKGGATIKLKSSYVKVSTSKKSVATIKAVKKNKKVVSYKVSAKKAGKATITIKVKKGTYKGTYKCKVTVKAAPKVTPKPTTKPTAAPTNAPSAAPTDAPTEAPTDAPTEAPTEEPTATPAAVKATVESASTITNDGKNLFVTLTLKEQVTAADLKDAKITLKGPKTVTATFQELNADGKAVFVIDDAAALKPGDTSANGEYTITSDSLTVENVKTDYEEALAGNAIAGYVVKAGTTEGVKNAKVSVEGGQSVTTDANGFYRLPATNGKKKVTVEAEGFLDNINNGSPTRIEVNRNHVTSQNFQMEAFDATKIRVDITAAEGATKVESATVTIKRKSDGKVIAGLVNSVANTQTTTTKATVGTVTYANSGVTGLTPATDIMTGVAGSELFAKGETYVVSVVKKLSSSNLTDVYAEQTAEFTIGNKYNHEVTVTMKKVAETPSMTIKQTWDAKDSAKIVLDSDAAKMKAAYQVWTTVNGNLEQICPAPADPIVSSAEQTLDVSANAANAELVAPLLTVGGKKATLPTGNYYVVITPSGNGASGTPSTPAVAVVKVAVTEGTAASATVKLTDGYTRQFRTNVELTDAGEAAVQGNAAKDALKTVKISSGAYVVSSNGVKVDYKISQIMDDGVEIPVLTEANKAVELTAANGTFTAAAESKKLLGYGKYKITSAGDYMKAVEKEESINGGVNKELLYNTKGTWNLVSAEVKLTADSDLVGATAANVKLTKFEVKNAADGKVVASKDLGDGVVATGVAGTNVADTDTLKFAIPATAMVNLDAGDYILEYTLKDAARAYKAVASPSTKMIPLEEATVQTTAKVVKATADAAQISGKITIKNDAGADAGLTMTTATSKALVVLLDANKKIAGLSKVAADGTYAIVDGGDSGSNKIVGGNYTLVFRMDGVETVAKPVKIDANETVAFDIQSEVGGNGVIKAYVQDTQLNALNNYWSQPIAYDEYYVVGHRDNFVSGIANATIQIANVWDTANNQDTATVGANVYNVGIYKPVFTKGEKIAEWNALSAGKYSVHMGVYDFNQAKEAKINLDVSAYKFKTESVILKNNGDKAYPEWEYEKAGSAGDGKVNVKVKFASSVSVSGSTYAIVAENADGTVEAQEIYSGNNSDTFKTISVPSNKTYIIKLYTMSGNQVSEASVTVQRVDTEVQMALNAANAD